MSNFLTRAFNARGLSLIWSGSVTKTCHFHVRSFAVFWLSCKFFHFEYVSRYFADARRESIQIFSLAPSTLANWSMVLVGICAENVSFLLRCFASFLPSCMFISVWERIDFFWRCPTRKCTNFLARTFGASELESSVGRDTPRKRAICIVSLRFGLRVARPFSARKLESSFGGDAPKRLIFLYVAMPHFHFHLCFPFLRMCRGIFEMSGGNTAYFSRSPLRRSWTRILFWSGCAPKTCPFSVRCFGVFWFSCTFSHFGNISRYFWGVVRESDQIFSPAPSALAD